MNPLYFGLSLDSALFYASVWLQPKKTKL